MFQSSTYIGTPRLGKPATTGFWRATVRPGAAVLKTNRSIFGLLRLALCAQPRPLLQVLMLMVLFAGGPVAGAQESAVPGGSEFTISKPARFVSKAAQFATLTREDYLDDCAFSLSGVITLVDTNRSLVVLQDETGAVAVSFPMREPLEVGQFVSLEAARCFPYVVSFPDYPFRPTGWDIQKVFEVPPDSGEYHLTRMRAYLRPPVTGEYTFWIASDNSSELWLSSDDSPSNAKRIASIARYSWVAPREWSKYPSQRSEPILLEEGRTYYIEALREQTTGADHLSVAWQGPRFKQSVIREQYLTPWRRGQGLESVGETNGVLREYWTDYTSGTLSHLSGALTYESALSAQSVRVTVRGQRTMPQPETLTLGGRLAAADNFRWVETEGEVNFAAMDGDILSLELLTDEGQIQVRALQSDWNSIAPFRNSVVRLEGVCEGIYDEKGNLVPGLIWVTVSNSISLVETGRTNVAPATIVMQAAVPAANLTLEGFYSSRGVITFNDRVFGKDVIYVQEGPAAMMVTLKGRHYTNQLQVGQWVDLGGGLEPRKFVPLINPLVITELGWRPLPAPTTEPIQFPIPGTREGRWTEVEGVVHAVNPDGTLALMAKAGFIPVWLGQTSSDDLSGCVDARLRVRGVLSSAVTDAPLLLVPSRRFVEVEEEAPSSPFGIPVRSVAEVLSSTIEPSAAHRVRLVGVITYRDSHSFFVEDQSGGIRVELLYRPSFDVGAAVEVIGFPRLGEPALTLSEALVRVSASDHSLTPQQLDLTRATSFAQIGSLIHVSATLLNQRVAGSTQVLELQEQQRVFEATLANGDGELPPIEPGSRLKVVGVCDFGSVALPVTAGAGMEKASTGPLTIRLRRPADVMVLRGPPWWTLQRLVLLGSALLTVLLIALLWAHLLRRRLERQHAARLNFSRQILQGQESERQRIAVNLHDSLGQNLLVIKNQVALAMQPSTDEPALRERLNAISEVTSQAIEDVRQITHGLRPYQLDRLGLTQAIRATVRLASENSLILFASYVDDIDDLFDKESEIHLYRIVQESVNNVLKHSGSTEAAVVVKKQDVSVSVSIRDNGRGFDPLMTTTGAAHSLAYGLTGITERVRILGGSVNVDSKPGQGTNLALEIPIPVANKQCRGA